MSIASYPAPFIFTLITGTLTIGGIMLMQTPIATLRPEQKNLRWVCLGMLFMSAASIGISLLGGPK